MANTQRPATGQTRHPNEPPRREQKPSPGSTDEPPPDPGEQRKYLAKQYGYTEPQIDVIRNQICPKATDEELEFFLHTAKRSRLDPFARQIYFIKRKQRIENAWGDEEYIEVGRPEVGIEGLRSSAEMTGEYDGQEPVQWCGRDGVWRDVWLDTAAPAAARAEVRRKAMSGTVVAVAVFGEFVPRFKGKNGDKTPQMWAKMPANQIAKCAEALALRKAFPRDLSGLYIDTEMEHLVVHPSGFEAPPTAATSAPAALPPPSAPVVNTTSAPTIEQLRKQLNDARTRDDLAPVGRTITALSTSKDPDARALAEQLKPEIAARHRELPPRSK